MDLAALKERLSKQVTVVDGCRIGKLNAIDGLTYSKLFADTDETDAAGVANAYAFLLSKCLQNEAGERELDSDEGRSLLLQLERETFSKLGQAALEWNLADAKKN